MITSVRWNYRGVVALAGLLTILIFIMKVSLTERGPTYRRLKTPLKRSSPGPKSLGRSGMNISLEEENIMRNLRRKDEADVNHIINMDIDRMSEIEAREVLYSTLARPQQGVCRNMKRLGGKWRPRDHTLDGDKFICLDKFSAGKEECIVYSFGVSDDWSFEDFVSSLNCNVFMYDHTVDPPKTRRKNIHFTKKGISTSPSFDMDTLENYMQINNHAGKAIRYLKVDVEGMELQTLPQWIEDGVLDNVEQIAIELHLTSLHNNDEFLFLLEAVKNLYLLGFRLISYEANVAAGPQKFGSDWFSESKSFYTLFEVVFMKDEVWTYLDN